MARRTTRRGTRLLWRRHEAAAAAVKAMSLHRSGAKAQLWHGEAVRPRGDEAENRGAGGGTTRLHGWIPKGYETYWLTATSVAGRDQTRTAPIKRATS